MLKKFVLVLLAMFALQLCWAVISAYCMHETDAKAQHFGHHAHQHTAHAPKLGELAGENPDIKLCAKHDNKFSEIHVDDQTNGHANAHPEHDAENDGKNASFHADCGSCAHSPFGHCAGNYHHHHASLVSYHLLATSPAPIAPFLAQPERPKWQVVA